MTENKYLKELDKIILESVLIEEKNILIKDIIIDLKEIATTINNHKLTRMKVEKWEEKLK